MGDNGLLAARVLMSDSLGFHIIFVMFGLALPVLVSWFEFIGIYRDDKRSIAVAKFLSKIMALLVVTGVISGTIIALQMSLVWPGILKFGGEVIGLPFMFETYAFLLEAVFLALYMATWGSKRVKAWFHWSFSLMIVLGSTLSAFAITSVNGWMNLPTGFDIIDGKFENVDVMAAMFSVTSLMTFFHSMPGYYVAAGLAIAGLYSLRLFMKKRHDLNNSKSRLDYFVIHHVLVFTAIALVLSAITGDLSGKYLAKYEPSKLAVIELHHKTQSGAPLIYGGVADAEGRVTGPHVVIPNALSLLVCNRTGCEVEGLDKVPKNEWPPLVVHLLFDIKMALVAIMMVALSLYFAMKKWRSDLLRNRLLLGAFGSIGITGIVVIELGWMLTEIGRQPWAVRGYVTTEQALTKTHDVTSFGYIFPVAYAVLFTLSVLALRKLVRDERRLKGGAL